MRPPVPFFASVFLVVLPLVACACGGGDRAATPGGRPKGPLEYPVQVEPAPAGNVTYSVSGVGSVEAFEKVQVTARVPGAVEAVRFKEGDVVRAGAVLVEVEPERYRLHVAAARAAVQKAQAALAEAEAGLARREREPGLFPAEEVASFATRAQVTRAEASQAQAALQQAELNLKDAYVRAPLQGIVETRSVQTGQYVQAGSTLASMVRREPLLVRLEVPERDAASLRPGLPAVLSVAGEDRTYSAVLTHVAGAADESSRMVSVTGRIDDPGRGALRPGAFAQVTIPVGEAGAAPVIPQTAVRPSEKGFLAYVVEGDVAHERVLTLGLRTPQGDVEVKSGLAVGESVVVRGAEALRDGVKVKVER
jgi:multidrug efflux system membrane fusion protein